MCGSTNGTLCALLSFVIVALRHLVVGSASILLVLQSSGYLSQLRAYVSQVALHVPDPATQMPDDMDGMVMNAPSTER